MAKTFANNQQLDLQGESEGSIFKQLYKALLAQKYQNPSIHRKERKAVIKKETRSVKCPVSKGKNYNDQGQKAFQIKERPYQSCAYKNMSNKSTASNSIGMSYSHKAVHFLESSEERKVKSFSRKTPARKKPDISIRNLVKNAVSSMKMEEAKVSRRMGYATECAGKPKQTTQNAALSREGRVRNIKLTFTADGQGSKLLAKLNSREPASRVFLHISKRKTTHKRDTDKVSQNTKRSRNDGENLRSRGTGEREEGGEVSKRSEESEGCRTVIEYDCENDYSLICSTLNKVFPF